MHVAAPCLAGSGPDGVFNLDEPSEAWALMRFLRIVSLNAKDAHLTCRMPIEPEMFWRADRSIQHEGLSPKGGRVRAWRDHVFEQRFAPPVTYVSR